MTNKLTYITAGLLLFIMFLTSFSSMIGDSLTFDELAHIPAGYSYLTQQDYRINPEHPPLIKDISAIPLLFLNLNFPKEDQTWLQEDSAPAWWVQFDLGRKFIFESGNDPRNIIIWARIPMILLTIFLGFFIFKWTRELAGNLAAILALFLFSFSPTILAHGRLVTTDVGAALGALMATYFWLKFLRDPKKLNIVLAGLFFGIAMISKFSLVLLIPFFGIITILYPVFKYRKERMKNVLNYLLKSVLVGLIALVFVIFPIYQLHVLNYPADQQKRDTAADLAPNKVTLLKNLDIWMSDKPVLKPLAQYLRGVLMASQRTVFGNTVYFLGQISASAWWYYFPLIFILKVPLALIELFLIVLVGLLYLLIRKKIQFGDFHQKFIIFSLILFLLIYWAAAMLGNLNIGIRHLMPTFPFVYILLALGLKMVIIDRKFSLKKPVLAVIFIVFAWYAVSSASSFPYYISYYNELAGGSKSGLKYAVDSNYDWGQDFYRLLDFIDKNNIEQIHLDYFGGESPEYWLGEKYLKLNPKEIKEPPSGWIAVSLNQLVGGIAKPVPGFDQETGYYNWLSEYTPEARIGYSILVYKID
ncbi:MAG: glycosyltransferase family 39 protein [Candidatus Nealsonbacteria bacterium]